MNPSTVRDLPGSGRVAVVTSVASDAHTWNLVFLQLLLEELGFEVVNLGACVPERLVVEECLANRPDIVVVSSVNGHGHQDGLRLIEHVRAVGELADLPVVIGGKLGVAGVEDGHAAELLAAGFTMVVEDGAGTAPLTEFLESLPQRALR
ncbi:methylaspartate mutase [Planobispora rosea]|uniref:Methylaspartate mutase n=1 Tax=Planobispora rosea TaxID=35762 RepID=A0A8J3S0G8_PLARO|nr:cobalamin-dependent protein [Planobispora rosea]GGS59469.1 methylaspartate mutase [Planobispora rosea]GIH84615.1 methylaspartate mutase [Planobispora rosea]